MRFVFVPLLEDNRPHRLFRWKLLPHGKLAVYDETNNLVVIDKEKYDTLTAYQKSRVLRTRHNLLLSDFNEEQSFAA